MQTLKDRLGDWVDFDGAVYELGVVLGLWADFRVAGGYWLDHMPKSVAWTNNPLGNALYKALESLAEAGALEEDLDESKFRWNPEYEGP